MKIHARCGQKDPRKPSAGVLMVIMAYLRSKSSENRVKASVGAKTRSDGQFFVCIKIVKRSAKGQEQNDQPEDFAI